MRFVALVFLFFIFVSLNVNALGLASDYLKDKTMELKKGETGTYGVRIQSPDLAVTKVRFNLNSPIAKVVDYKDEYTFSEEMRIIPITIEVTVSEDANVGDVYDIGYSVEALDTGGGDLGFGYSIGKYFKVKVIGKQTKVEASFNYLRRNRSKIIRGSIVLVIIIAIFLWERKRKKERGKKKR